MAPHSSALAWKIPWLEEPGRLQSMGSLRVRHDWATSLSLFTFMHWRRKWQPTPVFLPGEFQGWGEPGGLPSMGSHRVGHDWSDLAASSSTSTCDVPTIYWVFFFISWRLITLQYFSGFCHTLTWISHGYTCLLSIELWKSPWTHIKSHNV